MRIFLIILFVAIFAQSMCQNISIFGNSPSYSGKTLSLYKNTDLITNMEEKIGSFTVDTAGNFSFDFELNNTQPVYMYLGMYKGYIVAEPNMKYEVLLPHKQEKAFVNEVNPFFRETDIYLGVTDSTGHSLTSTIRQFDKAILNFVDNNYIEVSRNRDYRGLDSIYYIIDSAFGNISNPYFDNYKKYKYAGLTQLVKKQNNAYVTKENFLNQPILYYNTAYMELFNQTFTKFFRYYSQTKDGAQIIEDIKLAKSVYALKQTLQKDMQYQNDTLKELIILKGILDSYYYKEEGGIEPLPRPQLIQTLDSLIILTNIPEHKQIGKNIKNRVNRLLKGSKAPEFSLGNSNDSIVNLSSMRGKYVYINFCHIKNYECIKDFKVIQELKKQHDHIEYVTISTDESFNTAKQLFTKEGYDWTLLHYSNEPKVIKDYNVIAYPIYYLIDNEGKFYLSPGIRPHEEIEKFFPKKGRVKTDADELYSAPKH